MIARMVADRQVTGLQLSLLKQAVIAFVVIAFLSGCSESLSENTIRFALSNAPSNLDPRYATDATSERINQLLYSRLVEFDNQLLPIPSLASWENIDASTYRFTLLKGRPDFSNGDPITASDVAATYRYVLDKTNLSPHRQSISMIRDIRLIDEDTVEFSLSDPDPLFPAYLHIAILPEKLISTDHDFNLEPVGSGPFMFKQRYSQQRLLLERRSDGQLLEFIQVKDPTVRVLKLLKGEAHLLQNDLSPEIVAYLKKQPGISYVSQEGSNFTYIGFNLADPVTGNPVIRKAISHAINRDAIIRYAFNQAAVTAEALLPPKHWAGHPDLKKNVYDPDVSRQLLASQGYDDKNRLKLVYKTSSDPFRIKLATIIQSQLAEVGIDVQVKSFDWGTFFGDIKSGNFQMYSLSWVGINTPDIFRYVFHSQSLPPDGANRGRYQSAEVDQLLEQVTKVQTLEQQADIYWKIQAILHNDLPYIPLWYEHQQAFMDQRIGGYHLSSDGNYESLVSIRYQQAH